MAKHIETGKKGEALAVQYLKSKGYEILETNWRSVHKEIDIIAMDNGELVIVEVKTRGTDYFGYPEEAVDAKKQKLLISAAQDYVDKIDSEAGVRYDIVSIVLTRQSYTINHIIDAFTPGL
jgi:putative endonuclease